MDELEAEASSAMRESGFDLAAISFERIAMMRYAEQFLHELLVPVAPGPIDDAACARLAWSFDEEYSRLYGEGARSIFKAVEIFGIRIAARVALGFPGAGPPPVSPGASGNGHRPITSERLRQVYWPEERSWVPTAVYDGRALRAGDTLNGPAVVELPHTTVAVTGGQCLAASDDGNLVLAIG